MYEFYSYQKKKKVGTFFRYDCCAVVSCLWFFDGGGCLDVLSIQWDLRSDTGVLCNGCLAKKGPEQSSDTAAYQSRCHSMFVARLIRCVLRVWYNALTLAWSRGSTSRPEQWTTESQDFLRLSADTADNDDEAW